MIFEVEKPLEKSINKREEREELLERYVVCLKEVFIEAKMAKDIFTLIFKFY